MLVTSHYKIFTNFITNLISDFFIQLFTYFHSIYLFTYSDPNDLP